MTHGYEQQNAQRTDKQQVSISVAISHYLVHNELSFASTCQQGKCKHGSIGSIRQQCMLSAEMFLIQANK